jgi:hypothetical protein
MATSKELKVQERDASQDINLWLSQLYDLRLVKDDELTYMYDEFKYQGFDRKPILEALKKTFPDPKVAIQAVLICALRGPIQASKGKLLDGRTLQSVGIPGSGLKGTKGLSCSRITAATADLAAYYLRRLDAPKRLNVSCPGWLQFPSAGSIRLPPDLREQHREFAIKFSETIGGEFSDAIYQQMVANAYYDPKLKLFD